MKLKEKLLKILPIWLTCLLIVCSVQNGVYFVLQNKTQTVKSEIVAQKTAEPIVLGDSVALRGEPVLPQPEITKLQEPDTSSLSAKSFLVFDLDSGQNLVEKNTGQKLFIASLTKLLTGFVAYQNSDLNANFTVTPKDEINVKPNLNLAAGDNVKTLDLFNAMLIGSNNDAALALADYTKTISGVDFIDLMNREAQALGMTNSHFSNPMGFDSQGNYSTAADIKLLITATQQLAVFKNLGRRTAYEFTSESGKHFSTIATNKLLQNHPELEAIKTGFTENAGGAMASKLTVGTHKIIILVLDSKNRESDTLELEQIVKNDFKLN